ncbi:MAG: hypothetical protein M1839_001957 [Geoglossum umbratile]|nr:MAG: hypothetical protein M1839_001957 [Geoglossum umbratile]
MEQKAVTTVVKSMSIMDGHTRGATGTADEVRVLTMNEYREAGQCLALAFAQDEVARYFIDTKDMANCSEEEKWNLHVDILEYLVAAHCYSGLVTTIGPNYDAVALWMPPGKDMENWLTTLRSGIWRLYYKLSAEGRKRFFSEFIPLLHDTKQDVLGDRDADSYYLVYLGTRPESRRRGYAKELVEHMASRADAEGRAMYLESSAGDNVGYYQRLGFELKRKIYLSRGEKPVGMDVMVREPLRPSVNNGPEIVTIENAF